MTPSSPPAKNPTGQRAFYRALLISVIFVPLIIWSPYFFGWAADSFFAISSGDWIFRYAVIAILLACFAWGFRCLWKEWSGVRSCAAKFLSIMLLLFLFFVIWTAIFSALGRKQTVPDDAWRALRSPSRVVLYSIDPRRNFPLRPVRDHSSIKSESFHDHDILGSVPLDGYQAAAAKIFRHALVWPFGMQINCFDPRHALRVESGGHVYDFLVCFECDGILVFRDDVEIFQGTTAGSPGTLNTLLKQANVPLAKTD